MASLYILTSVENTSTGGTDIHSTPVDDVSVIARVQLVSQSIYEHPSSVSLNPLHSPKGG